MFLVHVFPARAAWQAAAAWQAGAQPDAPQHRLPVLRRPVGEQVEYAWGEVAGSAGGCKTVGRHPENFIKSYSSTYCVVGARFGWICIVEGGGETPRGFE